MTHKILRSVGNRAPKALHKAGLTASNIYRSIQQWRPNKKKSVHESNFFPKQSRQVRERAVCKVQLGRTRGVTLPLVQEVSLEVHPVKATICSIHTHEWAPKHIAPILPAQQASLHATEDSKWFNQIISEIEIQWSMVSFVY